MIRYPITQAELEAAVEREKRGWLDKARQKTDAFRAAGGFNEPASRNSWSEIKAAYIRLQQNKCAYCERSFGHDRRSRIEHDVEHFRPKSSVKAWPAEGASLSYSFATGDASETGYYLLAYNIFNYTTACKTCNSILKVNYFPVLAARKLNSEKFTTLKAEKPLLVYPIGELDDDPEELITFEGFLPVPKFKRGDRYRRARVTIDLFELDTREDLLKARAGIILSLWVALRLLQTAGAAADDHADAQKIVELATSSASPHTNCARAFSKLYEQDFAKARQYKERAAALT
ncbi:MAG: hypothetical protein SF097_09195 [Acidobacteriota bacterium]|nr:hypothetical protein [Acidobacteriota bacterium]